MRQIYVFLFVIICASCEYFNVKKISSDTIFKEELQTFNWNDVDEYPSFSLCDSLAAKHERKQCFESILSTHITSYLQDLTIIVTQDIKDTITLQFQVSETGHLELLNVKVEALTIKEIPNIKQLFKHSLDSLPKIFPAIKRGQQVKTEFKLPIIIIVD